MNKPEEDREAPGKYPYTRGIYPQMYRKCLWTRRQYSGFGTPRETNIRLKELLARGETGLSIAFDLPTQLGYDSNDDEARGEVGLVGVSVDNYSDFKAIFEDIPLDKVSVSFTVNGMAPVILALYLLLAREQGVPWTALRGTLQNDPLKEFTARGAWIVPPAPAVALATAVNLFCFENLPHFNPLSVSGYHIREAGATAVQEMAFTLAAGECYLERLLSAGIGAGECARRFSFFWAVNSDVFTEAAKLRAARRLWAKILVNKYGVAPDFAKMRFHTQTAGSTLLAANPLENISRVTLETLAAVLGGTQSHHACSYDEALRLPSVEAAGLSLATQEIVANESGAAAVPDPLGGSYYVEELTSSLEAEAAALLSRIEAAGGALKALDFMAGEIDGWRRPQYVAEIGEEIPAPPADFIPELLEKLAAGATVGQLGAAFRQKYGLYREPEFLPSGADILLAKVGMDGHDRGARLLFQKLKDQGHTVAYSGRRHTIAEIVALARQLKVKKVAVSILSGAHNYYLPPLAAALAAENVALEAGGFIPDDDKAALRDLGIEIA